MSDLCTWVEDVDGIWTSGCGPLWAFEYRIDESAAWNHCPFCGKKIQFEAYTEDEDEEDE